MTAETKTRIEKEAKELALPHKTDVGDYAAGFYDALLYGYVCGATSTNRDQEIESLREQNAKLKEALSQLIEILEDVKYVGFNNLPAHLYNEYKALTDSAKKLLTEEPLNQSHHDKEHKSQ